MKHYVFATFWMGFSTLPVAIIVLPLEREMDWLRRYLSKTRGAVPGPYEWTNNLNGRCRLNPHWQRFCRLNQSIVGLRPNRFTAHRNGSMSYKDLAHWFSEKGHLKNLMSTTDGRMAYDALLQRGQETNFNLRQCPAAVVKGFLHLVVTLTRQALTKFISAPLAWDIAFRERRQAELAMGRVLCGARVDGDDWITNEYRIQNAQMMALRHQEWSSHDDPTKGKRHNRDDRTKFELWSDGIEIMNRLISTKAISNWTVSGSTLIFPLRYGTTEATLPSGMRDGPVGQHDFDVYVSTDSWDTFTWQLNEVVKEFDFTYCGWQSGWPENNIFCMRSGPQELDIQPLPKEWAPDVYPTIPCVVRQRGQEATKLELPCPRRALESLINRFKKQDPTGTLTNCVPFPVNRWRIANNISEVDVGWLWGRAQSLHLDGYASMAPYYSKCFGHVHAALANSLAARPI